MFSGKEALEKANAMTKLSTDLTNWCIHYADPETNERWVLVFPENHNLGGGAPVLVPEAEVPGQLADAS